MLERLVPILKIACALLAAVILYQLSRLATWRDPLARFDMLASASTANKTNSSPSTPPTATNAQPSAPAPGAATNAARPGPATATNSPRPSPRPMPFGGPPSPQPALPAAIQARVDRITQSELLAPIQRPMPMALLGIAGKDVILRAANGQTGLIREGGELGGVKLLKIGTNRVLVEHEGQKQELMIFSGFGGESLLPK